MKSLIPLSLSLILCLSACAPAAELPSAEGSPSEESTTEGSSSMTTAESSSPACDDSLLRDEVISGSVKNDDGSILYDYEYHIPQICQDSEAAKNLNQELMRASPGEDDLYKCESIDWESHINGDLLSLILRFRYPSSLRYEYQVINYDCSLQSPVSREELLKRFSLNEEGLMEQLRFTAASYLDRANKDMEAQYLSGIWDLRAQTISDNNLCRAPLFVDDTGTLTAIITVNVPAGCGYDTPALQLKQPDPFQMTVTDSYATAEMRDGALAILFHKDENSRWSMGEHYVPHDFSIPVDRLYGNYVDMAIGNLAQEFWPVVILLDENGMISWVDIGDYDAATFSFHGVGPVACSSPVVSFSTHDVQGTTILCGVDAQGNTVDLYRAIYDASSLPSPYLPATNWNTEDGKYSLVFPQDHNHWNLIWTDGEKELAGGLISCTGMDGEGIHYHWSLFGLGEDLFGSMTLRFPPADSGDMASLHIINTSNGSLPGLPAGSGQTLIWEHP